MRILVAGVGSMIRSDDGLGPAVIERLKKKGVPEYVDLLDLGVSGLEILRFLDDYDKVIFIDSIEKRGKPGTIYHIVYMADENTSDHSGIFDKAKIGLHELDLKAILEAGGRLGVLPPKIVIIGCEPLDTTSFKIGLSKEVERALPELIRLIRDELYSI